MDGPSTSIGVPLRALLDFPGLGLQQVAGPAGDRFVTCVGITELEDPTRYLVAGQLLLTAGVPLPVDDAGIDAYTRRVADAETAALGFGVDPVYHDVPAHLAEACDRYGLPLLRIPAETPFVAINQAAYTIMAEARFRELRQISSGQSALATAAGRRNAPQAVVTQLAGQVDGWVALFDGNGNEMFTAGRLPSPAARTGVRHLAETQLTHSTAAVDHQPGLHLIAHTVPGTVPLALGIATPAPPTPAHHSITASAVTLLSLLTSPRYALGSDGQSAAALVRLLLGHSPTEVAPLLSDRWTVVHGTLTTTTHDEPTAHLAALASALGTPYLDLTGRTLHALIPADATSPDDTSHLGWTLGFSAPVPTSDLPLGNVQAERALHRALAAGQRIGRHPTTDPSFDALLTPEAAATHARARLGPLTADPVLLETLWTWLAHHGSWDRTADALQVHRNTVRQRIGKVGRLLGEDLQEPDVRMELWFALRWLPPESGSGAGSGSGSGSGFGAGSGVGGRSRSASGSGAGSGAESGSGSGPEGRV
ncbi:PucR family transcriptional regulator [Amycolatopsis jejuensis]|uniref:PucR family transcriptional regulator n=1 Tax=Amycolatopsis jejuensis TaxID=330084 RepID=UPI0007C5A403|nr:PucR family transcriptional regulator [Amycolatopsis jejuensis]